MMSAFIIICCTKAVSLAVATLCPVAPFLPCPALCTHTTPRQARRILHIAQQTLLATMHSFPTSTVNLTYASPRKQKSTIPTAASLPQARLGRKKAFLTENTELRTRQNSCCKLLARRIGTYTSSLSRCSASAVLANRLESLRWHAKAIRSIVPKPFEKHFGTSFRLLGHMQTKQTKTELRNPGGELLCGMPQPGIGNWIVGLHLRCCQGKCQRTKPMLRYSGKGLGCKGSLDLTKRRALQN